MRCPACHSRAIAHRPTQQHRYLCTSCLKTFNRPRSHPLLRWSIGLGLVLAASPLLLWMTTNGLLSLLPADNGATVDAIVVLGRGENHRIERSQVAAQLLQAGRSEKIFVSGMGDSPPILDRLWDMGIPKTALAGERCSRTTWENGLFSKTILESQGIDRILLITDRPHQVRSHWVFKSFGFEVISHPVAIESGDHWRNQPYLLMAREIAALIKYAATGKLQPQPAELEQQSEAAAQATIQDWSCSLKRP
ncbi:YdcF family protein [filamentous cyanobacterium CCP5]|nr:YdcF family protein [filamentous cyanobacterium CCP5]